LLCVSKKVGNDYNVVFQVKSKQKERPPLSHEVTGIDRTIDDQHILLDL
jgi:hypothetical protein